MSKWFGFYCYLGRPDKKKNLHQETQRVMKLLNFINVLKVFKFDISVIFAIVRNMCKILCTLANILPQDIRHGVIQVFVYN